MSASDLAPVFQQAGAKYNVDPDILRALVQQESNFNPNAFNKETQATGVMQFIPATAQAYGIDPRDPVQSINAGAQMFRDNLDRFNGNVEQAVAAHFAGPDQKQWGPKTQQYVSDVSNKFSAIKNNAGFIPSPQSQGNTSNVDAWLGGGSSQPAQSSSPDVDAWIGKGSAPTSTPTPAPTAPAAPPSFDLGRQLGLTARSAITGVTGIPAMVGDALNGGINLGIQGVNRLTGSNIPQLQMPSQVIQKGENAIGLPQPANATERVVQDAASAGFGVGGSNAIGSVLTKYGTPAVQTVGKAFTALPGMQAIGAASSGAAGGAAREAGFGPAAQIGASIAGGGAGVLAASGITAIANGLSRAFAGGSPMPAAQAQSAAQAAVRKVLDSVGDAGQTVTPEQVAAMERNVAAQLQQNGKVDPAALVRQQDFKALGMEPTLGQITRDPTQFSQELNLRGRNGVGEPLMARLTSQDQILQNQVRQLRGNPAAPYQAGTQLSDALSSFDEGMRQQVSAAYNAARQSSGKDLEVPLTGLAQDYANVLQNFAEKVPGGVRNQFESLGLMGGTQKKTFSIEDAENLLKVINANKSNDPATNTALGQLRDAVKSAVVSADDQGGVFAAPRQLAAQRFALQEAVPALKAAAEGSVAPDDFVNRFIINGKTNDVKQLASVLENYSPAAFQQARDQLGGQLSRAAFGGNLAGDKAIAPERLAEALRKIGPDKLGAFYSPDEVDQIQRIARVAAYKNSFPASNTVNTSNTAAPIMSMAADLVGHVPIAGKYAAALLRFSGNAAAEQAFVKNALEANLARTSPPSVVPQQSPYGPRVLPLVVTPPRAPARN